MSIAHRRLTRTTFGNRRRYGYHCVWGEGKSSPQQAWFGDERTIERIQEVTTERGGWTKIERRKTIDFDFGGCIFSKTDKVIRVRAGGYTFEMWDHQESEVLYALERVKPATDAPYMVIIGCRWWRVFLSLETAAKLREVLAKRAAAIPTVHGEKIVLPTDYSIQAEPVAVGEAQ